jgi:hypothetical protein
VFFYANHDLLQKILQDDEIFGGVSQKVMGRIKFFNACSGLPTHRHNYRKMLEFANKKVFKINSPYSTIII